MIVKAKQGQSIDSMIKAFTRGSKEILFEYKIRGLSPKERKIEKKKFRLKAQSKTRQNEARR